MVAEVHKYCHSGPTVVFKSVLTANGFIQTCTPLPTMSIIVRKKFILSAFGDATTNSDVYMRNRKRRDLGTDVIVSKMI